MISCWICSATIAEPAARTGDMYEVACPRCGKYAISASLSATNHNFDKRLAARMQGWLRQRAAGGKITRLTSQSLESIKAQLPDPTPVEKSDYLLTALVSKFPTPGLVIGYDKGNDYPLSFSVEPGEGSFHFTSLRSAGLIDDNNKLTPAAWRRSQELKESPVVSSFAFIAMRFNQEMLAIWRNSFGAAIRRAGYEPLLSGDPPHNERIDARIISDIKRSRFVVADVTHGNQGVYFEAGYALGIGRPVIWTCRRAEFEDKGVHFDVRQYNLVLWDTPEQLADELYYRIDATI